MESWKEEETLLDGCTHPHTFLAGLFPLSAQDKLGICNIDVFLLLLLFSLFFLAAARFCDEKKKVNTVI